ncbi:hypothetical protein SDC9_193326 [bioreactor metagenome]|uniref:Uncharacterized protein n=1 Tax=bioreactor metagenome TaxID=1076179 RepID=A0A645I388_9ZZZZ
MRAVAAVQHDRLRPADGRQIVADFARHGERRLMFRIRAGHAGNPFRIAVDQEPAPGHDVRVARRRLVLDRPDSVAGASQQIGIDRVDGNVCAGETADFPDGLRRLGNVSVVEIA